MYIHKTKNNLRYFIKIGLLLLISDNATAAWMGLPDITIIAFITIFIILTLLTIRELVRLRQARRILRDIEQERFDERARAHNVFRSTIDEVHEQENIERRKINHQSMKPDALFDELTLSDNQISKTATRQTVPSSSIEANSLSNKTFDRGFIALTKPAERYFKRLDVHHLLGRNPSRMQWFNIIRDLKYKSSSYSITSILQLATHNDEGEPVKNLSIHAYLEDLILGTRKLFPNVKFDMEDINSHKIRGANTELRRLLASILINAASANDNANSAKPITIAATRLDQVVILEVRDFGKGFNVNSIKRALNPKFDVLSEENIDYDRFHLIREYLQIHGDRSIAIQSNPKNGTKITVFLQSI